MLSQRPALAPGATFAGRYEILDRIGEGGFGSIHKARQLTTGQEVALKVMHLPERESPARADTRVARFLREARLCAQLYHPNIVPIIDSGQTADGDLYTVFAFVPGDNLADLLAREGALAPREARHLMLQVLDALACAHAKGVIHRDLKPSNIMVIPTGARRNALVLDFGIGAIVEPTTGEPRTRLTATNDALGTPGYGAPEQWRGLEPSPRADLFSWGLVFLECLTGTRVYSGVSAAEIFYELLGPDPVSLPAALERHPLGALLVQATKKDVSARDVSARGLLEALEACSLRGLSRGVMVAPDGAPAGFADSDTVTQFPTEADAERPAPARHALEGERRQLTALCCHVGARGAETRALDVEELDEHLRATLAICAGVVRRHRGHPAAVLGDDLLVYFGYPRAEEDDARRAARSALEVTGAVRAEAERLAARGVRIEVSIGIHTDLVVTGARCELGVPSLAIGATPRIAARLAAAAPPGSIAVTAEAQQLLRAAFDFEPVAPRSIEGTASSIEVSRLTQERDVRTSGATPDGARAPLVGRDQEIELLLERWRRTRGGAGQCSLITGEPGIGKSRLARELRDRLTREAHTFIEGRCTPDTQNTALYPIVDLLGRALGLDRDPEPSRRSARLEAQLAGYGFTPAEAMPLFLPLFALPFAETYRPLDVSPQRQKELTLSAVVSLLFTMTEKQPVLLLVEDLHWTDPTTIELLTQLIREAPSTSMCILLTARPEFSPSFSTTGMLQLHLSRLERPQIEALLTELVGHKALPPTLIEKVASRTDGVPLFVEELLRMMIDTGQLLERDDRYELSGPLPDAEIPGTLRALLAVRLDRLGRAKETAQLAAALGREFSVDVLSAASPLGTAAVQEDLDRLVGAGLVLRKRRLKDPVSVFKHALVRDAAYETLSKGARQRTHARIAETLEERFPEVTRTRPDLLAHHHAAAAQKREAIGYAQKAAMGALQRSAYAEAIAMAKEALGWLDGIEEQQQRAALELDLNGVLTPTLMASRGWADPEMKVVLDRSQELTERLADSPQAIPMLWALTTYHHARSHRADALALAERTLALAKKSGDAGDEVAVLPIFGQSLFFSGRHNEARACFDRAIELYDPEAHRRHATTFGQDSKVYALALSGLQQWLLGFPDRALADGRRAVEFARELNDANSLGMALTYLIGVWHYRQEREPARELVAALADVATRHGLPQWSALSALFRGWIENDPSAPRAVVKGFRAMGFEVCFPYWSSIVAECEAATGNPEAAIDLIDQCLARAEQDAELYYISMLHHLKGEFILQRDPSAGEAAEACFRRAIAVAREQGAKGPELRATTALSRVLGMRGMPTEARELLAAVHGWFAEGFNTPLLEDARALLAELGGQTPGRST